MYFFNENIPPSIKRQTSTNAWIRGWSLWTEQDVGKGDKTILLDPHQARRGGVLQGQWDLRLMQFNAGWSGSI